MSLSSLTLTSLVGLIALYFLSLYSGYVLNIARNWFYAPFHLTGGILMGMLFYSLTQRVILSILLTLIVGLVWEIYEQIVWRFLVKKKALRPQRQDTINDLILDVLGAGFIVLILR